MSVKFNSKIACCKEIAEEGVEAAVFFIDSKNVIKM